MLPITRTRRLVLVASTAFVISTALAKELVADPPKHCEYCEGWNQPFEGLQHFVAEIGENVHQVRA